MSEEYPVKEFGNNRASYLMMNIAYISPPATIVPSDAYFLSG